MLQQLRLSRSGPRQRKESHISFQICLTTLKLMAVLIPLPASAFRATYDANTRVLTLTAQGDIPKAVLNASFIRDDTSSPSTIKYRLEGYYGGLGVRKGEKPFETEVKEDNVDLDGSKTTVLVETKEGTWDIKVSGG